MMAAGCAVTEDPSYHELAPQKWGTGEVLRDLAPMVERVPALQSAESVVYLGGPRTEPPGTRDVTVPGPTDLWIDAIVTFDQDDPVPGQGCGSLEPSASPEVVPELASDVTVGEWVKCVQGAFPAAGWNVFAFLDADRHVVFLRLTSY